MCVGCMHLWISTHTYMHIDLFIIYLWSSILVCFSVLGFSGYQSLNSFVLVSASGLLTITCCALMRRTLHLQIHPSEVGSLPYLLNIKFYVSFSFTKRDTTRKVYLNVPHLLYFFFSIICHSPLSICIKYASTSVLPILLQK